MIIVIVFCYEFVVNLVYVINILSIVFFFYLLILSNR